MPNYNYSIESTQDNIKKALQDDLLCRNKWISKCLNLFLNMENTIIALNGKWGSGKTFIVREMIEIINEKFETSRDNSYQSYLKSIRYLGFSQIPDTCSYAIYYNAWEYDNDSNPMASFLYYLLKLLNKKIKTSRFKGIVKNIILNVIEKISDGWVKLEKDDSQDELEKVLESVLTSDFIRENINELINEMKSEKFNKLIIFVDELDRCRPTYALRVVEMLNQYFRRDDVLVICSIDYDQMSNIVKNNYGTLKNSYLYLDKIFDFRFDVPNKVIDYSIYVNSKIDNSMEEGWFFDTVFVELINEKSLSLRNIDRLLNYIKPMFKKYKNSDDSDFPVRGLVLYFFIPYVIVMKLFDIDSYNELMANDFTRIISFASRSKVYDRIDQIYGLAKIDDFKKSNILTYLKHDLEILINYLNSKKTGIDDLYVGRPYFNLSRELDRIDLLTYFEERVNEENGK